MWRVVFDGSGDEGLFGINAALAHALPPGTASVLNAPLLDDRPSWRVVIAYFGLDDPSSEPKYEQAVRIYDNGVIDELLLGYRNFTLHARLIDLESLPAPDC